MKATVVIVTYNRIELLKECIDCVEKQVLKFDNVVIVDNNSTDGTREFLKKYVDKYHIIFEPENGGGAKGFKDGIEYIYNNINTDWILLIDDDAMLAPDYLQQISIEQAKNKNCKAFSGSVLTEGKIDIMHRRRLEKGLKFNIIPVDINEYQNNCFEYDLSSFCGLMFHASLIEKIGYPKSEYFIWYDDSEYSLRIRKESRIINVNGAKINHKTKPSNSFGINWKQYYGVRNKGNMIREHGNIIQYVIFYLQIKRTQYKNAAKSIFSHDAAHADIANLFKEALRDLRKGRFGYNPKYGPK